MKFIKSLVLLAAVLLPFQPAQAAVERYALNKPHTQIIFSIGHMGYSRSFGKFIDYSGTLDFDRDHPEKSAVTVTIPTASLDLGDATWNEHMKAEKFFNVAKFPEMIFKSTAIKVTGDNSADITGDLTLLGVSRPVVLRTVFNKAERNPFGKYTAGFSATAEIKRSDFGMTEGIPFVDDKVMLTIEVEAERNDEPGQEQYRQ